MNALLFTAFCILACVACFSLCVAGFAIAMLRETSKDTAAVAEGSVRSLAQVKGLAPHQADPATFSPTGSSWDAVERQRITVVKNENAAWKMRRLMELDHASKHFEAAGNAEKAADLRRQHDELKAS